MRLYPVPVALLAIVTLVAGAIASTESNLSVQSKRPTTTEGSKTDGNTSLRATANVKQATDSEERGGNAEIIKEVAEVGPSSIKRGAAKIKDAAKKLRERVFKSNTPNPDGDIKQKHESVAPLDHEIYRMYHQHPEDREWRDYEEQRFDRRKRDQWEEYQRSGHWERDQWEKHQRPGYSDLRRMEQKEQRDRERSQQSHAQGNLYHYAPHPGQAYSGGGYNRNSRPAPSPVYYVGPSSTDTTGDGTGIVNSITNHGLLGGDDDSPSIVDSAVGCIGGHLEGCGGDVVNECGAFCGACGNMVTECLGGALIGCGGMAGDCIMGAVHGCGCVFGYMLTGNYNN